MLDRGEANLQGAKEMLGTQFPIGHSLGWVAAKVSSHMRDLNDIVGTTKGSAVELVIGPLSHARTQHCLTEEILASEISYRSIHLPSFEHIASSELMLCIRAWSLIVERHGFQTAVFHPFPNCIEFLSSLRQWSDLPIPFAIENMDCNKNMYQTVEDVTDLLRATRLPLVLDLQHAWEAAQRSRRHFLFFVQTLTKTALQNGGIRHLHVSGERRDGQRRTLDQGFKQDP